MCFPQCRQRTISCQGKHLSYSVFLSVKKVLGKGEKSKGILSRQQHCDNSVLDTLGSRPDFVKDPHSTEQFARRCNAEVLSIGIETLTASESQITNLLN